MLDTFTYKTMLGGKGCSLNPYQKHVLLGQLFLFLGGDAINQGYMIKEILATPPKLPPPGIRGK